MSPILQYFNTIRFWLQPLFVVEEVYQLMNKPNKKALSQVFNWKKFYHSAKFTSLKQLLGISSTIWRKSHFRFSSFYWAVTRIYFIFGVLKCISSKWNYPYILHSFDYWYKLHISLLINIHIMQQTLKELLYFISREVIMSL